MAARLKTRPEGVIARIGIDLAHLREALEDLERVEYAARYHSPAARTQVRGARKLVRGAIEALEQATISLESGTETLEAGLRRPRRERIAR